MIAAALFFLIWACVFGGFAAIVVIAAKLYRGLDAVVVGTVGGVLLFCRLIRWTWTHSTILARHGRRGVSRVGLFAAQAGYSRFFVWSYLLRAGYIRRELQARGKSVMPSSQDK